MKHLDLFSGIGGFALAARWAGIETIGFSEIDTYCCRVLEKNFPGVLNYGDVRTVPAIECDLITGGFPCQPFSCAGKRQGANDHRYLWPAMRDIIARCRPAWAIGENVAGIIGMELDRVCADLESLKFRVQPIVIPACAVDAPHRRDRVWIVAHAECRSGDSGPDGIGRKAWPIPSGRGERATLAHPASPRRDYAREHGSGRASLPTRPEQCSQVLANSLSAGLEIGQEQSARQECSTAERSGNSLPDPKRLDGDSPGHGASPILGEQSGSPAVWPDESEWFAQSGMGRVSDGIPHRVDRLRGLGNSIVPQVAFQIMQAILGAERMKP